MEVKCVWWDGYHNAFTDIAKYRDNFYITFRHATEHQRPGKGEIYVIKSKDTEHWELIQKFPALPDSRDPKFFLFQDKLGIVFFGSSDNPDHSRVFISYSDDGKIFSQLKEIKLSKSWIWRIRNHKGILYATVYKITEPFGTFLFKSENGEDFELVSTIVDGDLANEADILFEDEVCYAFVRRENNETPVMAISRFPYTKWERYTMNIVVKGPHIFKFSEKIYCSGRVFLRNDGRFFSYVKNEQEKKAVTGVVEFDRKDLILRPVTILPSGGDNSYCGHVIDGDKIYISYYSQHELEKRESFVGKNAAGIYLAIASEINSTLKKS